MARDRGFTTLEGERFAAWLAASQANVEAWARAERLWTSFEDEPDVLLEGMRVAALRARPIPQLNRSAPVAAAAAVTVLLLIGFPG